MGRYDVIKSYFRFLKQSSLAAHDVVLSAGAAMVVLGHRRYTSDLDVDVPEWFFLQQKQTHNYQRRATGEFVQYNKYVSLQIGRLPESDIQIHVTKLQGDIYVYSDLRMLEQKVRLLEQPNRNPGKLERDAVDCWSLFKSMGDRELSPEELDLYNRYQLARRVVQRSLA